MQNFRNYYEILGVRPDASTDTIKQAYRQLARRYHPDLNPSDRSAEDKFKLLGEAYDVLSDADKRSEYDGFSRYWRQFSARSRNRKGQGDRHPATKTDFSQFSDFNSFIDQLLGERLSRETSVTSRPPSRRRVKMDAFQPGTTKTAYTVRQERRDAEARLTIPLLKAYQGGPERIRLEDGRSLAVNMPGGMVSGQRIRLRGQGVKGGDLYLKIQVARHPFFQLAGVDIVCQVPVTPSEAVLGGTIKVPTLDGLVKMTIPPGVQSAKRLRLAGKGYPSEEGQRGDQIVEIQIVIPQDLTSKERELYEKLRQLESFAPRAKLV